MKSMKNRLVKTACILSLFIFSFTSCEVGLGATVDTEPPELAITSPESASIIRGAFALKGSWKDDGEIDKVFCVLKNTTNENLKYTVNGEAKTDSNGKGVWSIIVENGTVADGSYEASVSIFDKAGHETKVVRQFVIDNTSPVIILKRPSSRKGEENSENIDGYGQVFSLKGLAADDSGVGLIEVSIYSDEALTQLVKTVSIKNVPNTISLDVAEFEEGVENDYSAIYGSTNRTAGEQKRWCRVIAYDGAQSYPIDGSQQTEEDKKGNAVSSYYLYEDISSTILSQYKITDLYAMKNGSYKGDASARSASLEDLKQKEITAGVFTLNPANNPCYTVSGFQELKLDGTDFGEEMTLKNGSSLVISVKPGLDSYEILNDSLKVFLQQCDKNGNSIGDLIPMENITKEKSGTSYIIAVPVAKGAGIYIGKQYRLIVTGQDEKGNPVIPKGNGYGFYLDANSVKPSLKVLQPQSSATVTYKNEENSLVISGKVYFSSESCDGGSVIIKDSTGNMEWLAGTFMDEKDADGNIIEATQKTDKENNWSITLNFKKDNTATLDAEGKLLLPDGNHTLNVYAITGTDFAIAENIVNVERNFKVDTLKPRPPVLVKVTDKTEEKAYSAAEWYNDKNLKVALEVVDDPRSGYSSGLSKTEYLTGSSESSEIWASLAAASYGYINGLNDGENTVRFRSVDGVGNKSDVAVVTIKVDTVAPEIKKAFIGENNAANNGWDELTAGNILNIRDSHKTNLKFEIEEARKKPVITVKVDGTIVNGAIQEETAVDGKWTWISNNEVSLTQNKEIPIKIKAEDGAHNEEELEYKVLVDTKGPVITITSPDKDLEGADSLIEAYTLRAGINDAAGNVAETKYLLTKINYPDDAAIKNAVLANGQIPENGKGSVSVSTASQKITKGKWYLYIYSKDEADNESVAKRAFWFDSKNPVLAVNSAPNNKYIINLDAEQNINQNISISGSASDGTALESNGIKKITYSYSTDNGATYSEPVDLNADENAGTSYTASTYDEEKDTWSTATWNISLPYGTNNTTSGALSDGNYKFVISATDNAGKIGSKEYDILIDTVKPHITLPSYGADEWFSSLKIDMDITTEDATSGINLVQYNTSDNANYPSGGWIPFTYDDSTKKASGAVGFTNSGIKTVYLKATDVAGNTEEGNFIIKVDADKPTLTPKFSQIGNAPIGNFGGTTYENGKSAMTFWGEYRDIAADAAVITGAYPVSGVKPLSLILTKKVDDADVEKVLAGEGIQILYSTEALPDTASGAMPESFVAYESISDITHIRSWKAIISGNKLETGTVSIRGEDKAGNIVTAQKTTNLEHDEKKPEINNSNISVVDNSNTYTKAYRSSESSTVLEYYVNTNNVSSKTFTIKGSSTDEVGVASTVLKIGETSYPNSGTPGAWNFTVTLPESGPAEAVIITTDLAGNTNTNAEGVIQNKIIFKYDNTAPVKSEGSAVTIEGATYESGMWGKSKVVSVAGSLTEAGSGASKVYYRRYASPEAAQAGAGTNGFITDYRSSKDGFIDIAANASVYNGKLTSLDEGKNYVLLIAEDNVGNAQLVETAPYYLQIDTQAPVVKSTSGGTKYIGKDGNSGLTVTADCTDTNIDESNNQKASGIKEVKVSVKLGDDGPEKTAEVTHTGTDYSGSWTATFNISKNELENIEDGSEFDISALVTDKAGHSTPLSLAKLKVDKTAPDVNLSSVSQIIESANKSLPKASENSCYMRPDKELIVKGFTSDAISTTVYTRLILEPYTINGETGTEIPVYESSDTNHMGSTAGSWTLTVSANTISAEAYKGAKLYACTKDLAGNERKKEIQDLIFDVTGPVYQLEGNEAAGFVPTKIDGKDYISDPTNPDAKNWYSNNNLMIQGTWKDFAGVTEVYYERVSGSTTTITQNKAATESPAYPSFTVSNNNNGLYTFNTEIREFESGENTLLMYAKDALGNISVLGKSASIWVDTTIPTVSTYTDSASHEYKFNDIYYTNAKEKEEQYKLKLYFYAEDESSGSGIDNSSGPIIKIEDKSYEGMAGYSTTDTPGKYLVTVTPDETKFAGKNGYIPLIVTIKDKAGNANDINIGTINVDEKDPKVTLSAPKNAGSDANDIQVNGIITIKGSASDENLSGQPLVALEYTTNKDDDSSWKNLLTDEEYTFEAGDITNASDFSVKIDTTKLLADDTAKFPEKDSSGEFYTYYIRASAKDEAGNIGQSNLIKFKINQDTDRPVVDFMDITLPKNTATSALLKLSSKKLRLTVTDDDEVDEVTVILNANEEDSIPLENPSIKNDIWTYDLNSIADGTYTLTVKVKDKEARVKPVFESGTDNSPKFTGGERKIENTGVALSLMLDNSVPVTRQNQFAFYEETSETLSADELTWANTAPALGGKRKYLALKVEAGDENKIAGIIAKIDNVELSNAEGQITKLSEETSPAADNKINSIWFVKDIAVSSLSEGEHKLEIIIEDGAENKKSDIVLFSIDKTPPVLSITSPKPNAADAESYSSGSIQAYGSISGATKLYYAVSPKGKKENDPYTPNGTPVDKWEKADGTEGGSCTTIQISPAYSSEIGFTANWSISFDSSSAATGVHTYLLRDYLLKFGITTEAALKDASFTTPVRLYLWLKSIDEVGNEKEESYPIIVNPQGTRPTIQFSYPENGATLGNTVNIYGTHSDTLGEKDIGVKSVWVQFISKAHDNTVAADETRFDADNNLTSFTFNWNDLSYMKANGYKIYKIKDYDPAADSNTEWDGAESEFDRADEYAALAKINGLTWSLTINASKEFDNSSQKNPVGIRVFAKDGDGELNTIQAERLVYFDSNTPQIKDLQLVQSDTGTTLSYKSGMYISSVKGAWTLKGKAEDDGAITKVIINGSEPVNITYDNKVATFEYPLSIEGEAGTISLAIEASDESTETTGIKGTETVTIRFDNKKPVLVKTGTDYNINQIVQQSNGFYKFGSSVKEEPAADGTAQSGFAYTAFYFIRVKTENGTKVYDILKGKNQEVTSAVLDGGTNGDNLYWYAKTVDARQETDDPKVLTLSAGSDTTGVQVNRLVKIGGAYYKITEVTGNQIKINGNPPRNETVLKIAAAGLVDNATEEKIKEENDGIQADGYYKAEDLKWDDGDRMLEAVSKSGSTWNWSTSVCSKNISDGPVKLVYVVFDEAGNFDKAEVDCLIRNNTPRIAGLTIRTDYNNNGQVNDAGIDAAITKYISTQYSASSVTKSETEGVVTTNYYDPDTDKYGKKQPALSNKLEIKGKDSNGNDSTSIPVLTLRGKTVITPEIVGGNGKVSYFYTINGKDNKTATPVELLEEGSTDYTIKSEDIIIQPADLVRFGNTDCTNFEFEFVDEMDARSELEGTDYSFNASQKKMVNAYLSVYMGIKTPDTNSAKPSVKIKPFYWKGLNDNSIYGSSETTVISYRNLAGHIELEGDLPDSFADGASDKERDRDPKVSGKIVVTGSVHDDNLINSISIRFADFICSEVNGVKTDKKVAAFSNGTLHVTDTATLDANGYQFIINSDSEKFDENGHDVEWTLYLDTEKFNVALDAELTVTAANLGSASLAEESSAATEKNINGTTSYKQIVYDESQASSSPGNVQTKNGTETAYYKMDIVPYIKEVTTSLSKLNAAAPSVYDRSALGRYPVYAVGSQGTISDYETIGISGFNLTGGKVKFTGTEDEVNVGDEVTIPAGAKSGYVSVVVSEISSLNNENNNNSRGLYGYEKQEDGSYSDTIGTVEAKGNYEIYSNYYNRIPNNRNNNNLTDDVYLNIWGFNSEAALAEDSGLLDNLEMKINPDNGLIGFAFTNGSTRFSMPENTTSYSKWTRSYDCLKHNALAYDYKGNSYAVTVGGDINDSGGFDFFTFMSGRWGAVDGDDLDSNKGKVNHLNLDSIASKGGKTGRQRDKDRFQSQSIAANGDNIYLAYYDMMYSQIRFKAGTITNTRTGEDSNDKCFGNFHHFKKDYGEAPDDEPYCQIIADGTSNTFGNVGEYVSIGVLPYSYKVHETDETPVSGDIVAIVWYDGNNLQFAYGVDPLGNVGTDGKATNNKVKNNVAGWVGATKLISGGGEYCQLAVANDNSIHIAAYNSSKADLEYIYIPFDKKNHKPNVDAKIVCSVDTYLDVGEQLTIDVAEVNEKQVPYIGYWGAFPEKPRYAYLADPAKFHANSDAVTDGAIDNYYTGVWECMVVPSQSSVKDCRKISVGVWKYNGTAADNGKLAYSTIGTNVHGKSVDDGGQIGTSTATETTGNCYGNGTTNGVLAYVVVPTSSKYCAETAQMK